MEAHPAHQDELPDLWSITREDYIVHHMKANGKLAPKVFKLAKKQLRPRETLSLSKRHAFRPLSTRVYHPGRHALELQVNGQRWGWQEFELVIER